MEKNNNDSSALKTILTYLVIIALACSAMNVYRDWNDKKNVPGPLEEKLLSSDTTVNLIPPSDKWFPLASPEIKPGDSVLVLVPAIVDTMEILKKYFTRYSYTDTLQDSSVIIVAAFNVEKNKVDSFKLNYKLQQPSKEITITNKVEAPAKAFFLIGATAGLNRNLLASFGPEALYITRRKRAYGLGYDILNKSINVSVYYPLNK